MLPAGVLCSSTTRSAVTADNLQQLFWRHSFVCECSKEHSLRFLSAPFLRVFHRSAVVKKHPRLHLKLGSKIMILCGRRCWWQEIRLSRFAWSGDFLYVLQKSQIIQSVALFATVERHNGFLSSFSYLFMIVFTTCKYICLLFEVVWR